MIALVGDRREESITWGERVVSTALWAINLAFLVPAMALCTLVFKIVPAYKVDFLSKAYCRIQMALTFNKWRAVVHPDVDPQGVYIFAQNHTNHFDHVAMYNATPHFKQGVELESHFDFPFYGWFMKARGTIPVPEGGSRGVVRVLKRMQQEVDRGNSILTFPEGSRTLDGRVGPFQDGIFFMAIRLGVPVVPVAVTGMYDVMRKGSSIIRPGRQVTVYVDEPIPTASLTRHDVARLRDQTRQAIATRIDAYFEEKAA